ncbi:MAG: hypothetical protein A2804_01700 [Candidatus Pacebacteria bacterium RIFCSPHIGHO2_01_FULL_46_10]|nr:MAG: hypothetical protein A2804_01700 [Candidatus Pacebacteria bacterium RIFCSPHIGHO2_01_FULL_46_10]
MMKTITSFYKNLLVMHVLILLIAVGATFASWKIVTLTIHAEKQRIFNQEKDQAVQWLTEKFSLYYSVLRSFRAFWYSNPHVSQSQWEKFVKDSGVISEYPGISSVFMIKRVQQEDTRALEQDMRRISNPAYKKYTIYPIKKDGECYLGFYIYPTEGRETALGLDHLSIQDRQEKLFQARDTGNIMNTRETLLLNTGRPGFFLVAPLYDNAIPHDTVDGRRKAFWGFSAISFRSNELFSSIYGNEDPFPFFDFEIYDGTQVTPENLLYDHDRSLSAVTLSNTSKIIHQQELKFDGNRWTIVFATKPNFTLGKFQESLPWIVLGIGGVFSAFVVLSLVQQSMKITQIRKAMDKEKTV